jgi:hypothetical protein
MHDQELEKKLKDARCEADQFFSHWHFNSQREMVHKRVGDQSYGGNKHKSIFPWIVIGKASIVLVSFLFLIWIPYRLNILLSTFNGDSSNLGTPLTQQSVTLEQNKSSQWVNFFRLDKPDRKQHNLLAVIWNTNSDGNYKMIYSSLLENSDKPHPVSTIEFPENHNKLALISSSNPKQRHLHYRLIGVSNDVVKTYWEQDFVPDGKVEVREGMLIERRTVPQVYFKQENMTSLPNHKTVVTYFIPYQINDYGDLVLTTNYVRLGIGEYLAFIGENNKRIRMSSNEKIIKKLDDNKAVFTTNELRSHFYAFRTGRDILVLEPDTGEGKGQMLQVEVVDASDIQ